MSLYSDQCEKNYKVWVIDGATIVALYLTSRFSTRDWWPVVEMQDESRIVGLSTGMQSYHSQEAFLPIVYLKLIRINERLQSVQ